MGFKVVGAQEEGRGAPRQFQTRQGTKTEGKKSRNKDNAPGQPARLSPPQEGSEGRAAAPAHAVTVHRSLEGPASPRRPGPLGGSLNAVCHVKLPASLSLQMTSAGAPEDDSSNRRHPSLFNKWQRGPGTASHGQKVRRGRGVPGRTCGPGARGSGAGPRSLARLESQPRVSSPGAPAPSATHPPRSRGPAVKTLGTDVDGKASGRAGRTLRADSSRTVRPKFTRGPTPARARRPRGARTHGWGGRTLPPPHGPKPGRYLRAAGQRRPRPAGRSE